MKESNEYQSDSSSGNLSKFDINHLIYLKIGVPDEYDEAEQYQENELSPS